MTYVNLFSHAQGVGIITWITHSSADLLWMAGSPHMAGCQGFHAARQHGTDMR